MGYKTGVWPSQLSSPDIQCIILTTTTTTTKPSSPRSLHICLNPFSVVGPVLYCAFYSLPHLERSTDIVLVARALVFCDSSTYQTLPYALCGTVRRQTHTLWTSCVAPSRAIFASLSGPICPCTLGHWSAPESIKPFAGLPICELS